LVGACFKNNNIIQSCYFNRLGFSPVLNRRERDSRFNGFPAILKAGTSDFENTP